MQGVELYKYRHVFFVGSHFLFFPKQKQNFGKILWFRKKTPESDGHSRLFTEKSVCLGRFACRNPTTRIERLVG